MSCTMYMYIIINVHARVVFIGTVSSEEKITHRFFSSRQFYTKQSVLCHPVYGQIFQYLIGKLGRRKHPVYPHIERQRRW